MVVVAAVPWRLVLSVIVLGALAAVFGFEVYRAGAIYQFCVADHSVFASFTTSDVCTSHPMMHYFAARGLADCTRAITYVTTEQPLVCTARNWLASFWLTSIVEAFSAHAVVVLGSWSLVMFLFFFCAMLACIACFYVAEREGTARKSLEVEQTQLQMDKWAQILTQQQRQQQQIYAALPLITRQVASGRTCQEKTEKEDDAEEEESYFDPSYK